MKLKIATLALVALLLSAVTLLPMSVEAAQPSLGAVTVPVTLPGSNGSTFTGTATITNFVVQNGVLNAVGTLTGTLTSATGATLATLTNTPFTAPVTATGSCTILTLDIGAIHLNLLGLVVDLAPIHLNITAQQGPGNLLGNLLCAVANLLNNGGPLTGLANLLNQILGILNGLTL